MKHLVYFICFAALFFVSGCCHEEMEQTSDCEIRCSLEPDPGMCLAALGRYYYDQNEKKCKVFSWGGCGGVVPFETLEECEACGCK